MKNSTANKIADLVNRRNKLPNKLEKYTVLTGNYFYVAINEGKPSEEILACVRAKCMSFFCYELKHLAVNEQYEGQGMGQKMIEIVEDFVRTKKVPVLCATTRADNQGAIRLFNKLGYKPTKEFTNAGTSNPCVLWQKDLL